MPASSTVSGASSGALAAGIFATEVGQRLLQILQELTRHGFEGLYLKCKHDLRGAYYQAGLRRVHLWPDETLLDDLRRVRGRCPDLDETYEESFAQYVSDRYRGRRRPTVRCPPLLDFTRRFLESVAQHDALVSGDYFAGGDVLVVRVACMDAARQALYALVTAESVRVELASEAGSAVSTARDLRDATPADVRRLQQQREAPPPMAAIPPLPPSEVTPADSISQVGQPPPREEPVGPPPPREEPVAVAREEPVAEAPAPPPPPRAPPSAVGSAYAPPVEAPAPAPPPPPRAPPSAVGSAYAPVEEAPAPPPPPRAPPSAVGSAYAPPVEAPAPAPPPRAPPSAVGSAYAPREEAPAPAPPPRAPPSAVGSAYAPVEEARRDDGRHDFATEDALISYAPLPSSSLSIASAPARARAASNNSSVSIGMNRAKSPRRR